jgi:putative phosphoribosyl transferase
LRTVREVTSAAPDALVVVGLPRGGVPVAYEVATDLGAPLDVILVRKLGVPGQPELAMGAIGERGARVVNQRVVDTAGITSEQFAAVEAREGLELERRARQLRGARARVPLAGRTALIVDDGIATGATARAACEVARAQGAALVVLAAPVAPPSTIRAMRPAADEVVVVDAPEHFFAIGEFYSDFSATTDETVLALLNRAAG